MNSGCWRLGAPHAPAMTCSKSNICPGPVYCPPAEFAWTAQVSSTGPERTGFGVVPDPKTKFNVFDRLAHFAVRLILKGYAFVTHCFRTDSSRVKMDLAPFSLAHDVFPVVLAWLQMSGNARS